jgi:hypothetical protein
MVFKKTYCRCLGESRERTIPWEVKRELNNKKLTRYMANNFIAHLLYEKKIKLPIKVTFSKRTVYIKGTRCKKWGEAYNWSRNVVLFRHSVWLLLHEVAHIVAPVDALHDYRFAKNLRLVHGWWKEFKGEK